jgi:hypothetical protein
VTVHLISVGRSMLAALTDPESKVKDRDECDAIRAAGLAGLLPDTASPSESDEWMRGVFGSGRQADAVRAALAAVDVTRWPPEISAEVNTFARVDPGEIPLRGTDRAVLICSDTPRGLLAGLWNAAVLTGGDLGLVRYLSSPGSRIGGRVMIVRVPELNARSDAGFGRAMGGLGVLARNLLQHGKLEPGEEFRFYLSGGYKAAIPYLIGLAEAVRSVDQERLRQLGVPGLMLADADAYPVRAFVLHEDATPGTPAIELPLRRLVADSVREELAGFDSSLISRKRPEYGLLEGYAYEKDGRTGYKLTAFGVGLRELHGSSFESLI